MVYLEKNLIVSDGGIYLTVDSLIELSNKITGSNNITFRNVNVKAYGFDKIYMDKELMEYKLYQIIDQFKESYIYKVLFNTIKQNTSILWWEWCKILFANDDISRQNT